MRRKRQQSGFLMLDALIAILVLAVTIVPVENILIASQSVDRQAQLQTVATNAAEMELETLRGQAFAVTAMMSSGTFTIPPSLVSSFPNVSMAGSYTVSTVGNLGDSAHQVLQIATTVTWTRPDSTSVNSNVTMDSYETQGAVA